MKTYTADEVDEMIGRALAREREARQQEPVEWLTGCPECGMDGGCDCSSGTWNPPASKPWVGLTDEEAAATAYKGFDEYWTEDCKGSETEAWAAAGRAIEAKLREKNA